MYDTTVGDTIVLKLFNTHFNVDQIRVYICVFVIKTSRLDKIITNFIFLVKKTDGKFVLR
jgi:hypothetical protein